MRNKLAELLEEASGLINNELPTVEQMADYLIEHGVIVMPCKVGDDTFWIDTEENRVRRCKKDIKAVCYYGRGDFKVITSDCYEPEDLHTKWCMLSEKEAKKMLAERVTNERN